MLRGASKDTLNEVERNLQDAMSVARNIYLDPFVLPGGGAVEMAVGKLLNEKAKSVKGVIQWPYRVVSKALEVIPLTLIQNCGGDTIRTLTALRAKHASASEENKTWGIDGEKGNIVDIAKLGVWEPLVVKSQAYKTAIEVRVTLFPIFLNCLSPSVCRLQFSCYESMTLSLDRRNVNNWKRRSAKRVCRRRSQLKSPPKMIDSPRTDKLFISFIIQVNKRSSRSAALGFKLVFVSIWFSRRSPLPHRLAQTTPARR